MDFKKQYKKHLEALEVLKGSDELIRYLAVNDKQGLMDSCNISKDYIRNIRNGVTISTNKITEWLTKYNENN